MIIYILIGCIFFIFLDELIMGCSQRRIGPINLGVYGIFTSIINGCNLIISQFLIPKINIYFGFQVFPIFFLIIYFYNYIILYPFFLIDLYNSIILILLLIGICLLLIHFSAFSSCSKYSILGSIRIISQFISFELIFTTIILIYIWSWNNLSIVNLWLIGLRVINNYLFNFSIELFLYLIVIMKLLIFLFNIIFLFFFFISILGESNRIPFDLSEAESELVAGFITEYSSIYFSLILLTEYGSIILLTFFMIIIFSIIIYSLLLFILIICFLRSTLNRLKFDELMTNAWINFLAILFPFLFFSFIWF